MVGVVHEFQQENMMDIFRLRGCETMNKKYTFLFYFSLIFPKIDFFFGGIIKNNIVMSIYTYLFPMCLLRKAIFFYSLTLNPKSDRKFDVSYIPN